MLMAASIQRFCLTRTLTGPPVRSHGAVASSLPWSGRAGVSHVAGEQAVLHREQAGGHAAGGADLDVDVLDVIARGLGRDDQTRGDLLTRQPPGQQPQYVDLAGGKPGRSLTPP